MKEIATRRRPRKIKSGGTRMKELGYKPIQIWLDREDLEFLKVAAANDGRPLTRYVLRAAMQLATLAQENPQLRRGDNGSVP
jgi:hypothetical protein